MMKKGLKFAAAGFAAAMITVMAVGCAFASEIQTFENGAFKLTVPEKYADLVEVETDKDGMLFSVTEKASMEAAGNGNDGAGWLFGVRKVSEEELHETLCGDSSGEDAFARDEEGNGFMLCHPTDVRLVRENNEEMDAAMDQWTELTEWANTIPETFTADNGLSAEAHTNTDLDIILARIAYKGDVNYKISTLEFGPLDPEGTDAAPFLDRLMKGATITFDSETEAPAGEYIVLQVPDEDLRFDFFPYEGSENIVREVRDEAGYEVIYKVTFEDETVKASDIMQEWYDALAAANGRK